MPNNIIHNTDSLNYMFDVYVNDAGSNKIIISDPIYNIKYKYEAYNDNLSKSDYEFYLRKRLANIRKKVIIHYPEPTINVLPKAFNGQECEFIVTWTYSTRIGKQSRLISWWGCKPDLTKVKVPYAEATLKDPRNQHKLKDGRSLSDHWLIDFPETENNWHIPYINNKNKEKIFFGKYNCPQIPEEVMRRIILTTVKPEWTIVDPFSGTGTTSKVAKDLGFNSIAFEIGKETHAKSLERLSKK